jgi:hypothetical protein
MSTRLLCLRRVVIIGRFQVAAGLVSPIKPNRTIRIHHAASPRFFSTTTRNPTISQEDADAINVRAAITQLMGDTRSYPSGSLTAELIHEAEEALQDWVFERHSPGFDHALNILRRLLLEQEYLETHHLNHESNEGNEMSNSPIYQVRPFLLNQVVDCWRTCWRDKVLEITPTDMLSIVDEFENRGLSPDNRTFTLIVEGMILRGDPFDAPLLAQWLLDRRMKVADVSDECRPDTIFFTTVINAWAKSGRIEAPEMADGLLHMMQDLYANGWSESAPNTLSYGVTISAWYNSRHADANLRIEALLEEMKNNGVVTDVVCYMYALNGWANSRAPGSAQKAFDTLQEMLHLYNAGNVLVQPRVSNFSKVMVAFARTGDIDKVEELWSQLQDLYYETNDSSYQPNEECWKAKLIALAKSGSARDAQNILDGMVDRAKKSDRSNAMMPKRSYFIDVLVAWTKQRDQLMASENAEAMLMQLLDLSKSGYPDLTPDAKCFEKVIQSWSKTRHESAARKAESLLALMDRAFQETRNERVKPTFRSFDLVLSALSRSGQKDSPQRAETLIAEIERRFSLGDKDMRPSKGAYTSLMLTWQRSRLENAPIEIEKMFKTLEKRSANGETYLYPDLFMYSVLMDVWAERGDTEKVQMILNRILEAFADGNNREFQPDIHVFNKVLKAWVMSQDRDKTRKAEETFQQMHALSSQYTLYPNRQTYNEMILVWSKSREKGAAERAEYYLGQLKERNLEPTVVSYRAVIDAWVSSSNDSRATARAESLLDELLEGVRCRKIRAPLYKPYRNLLQSIARSKIPRRSQQAQELLRTLQNGQVHPNILPI